MTDDVPTPWTKRKAISQPTLGANAQPIEPTINNTRPT